MTERDARGRFAKPQRPRGANGRFVEVPRDNLDAIRADYEAGEMLLVDVAAKYRMSLSTLNRLRLEGGWVARQPRLVDPNDLVMRLFGVIEAQTKDMEMHMTGAGMTESAVLNRVAAALDRLMELKKKATPTPPSRRMTPEQIAALRTKLFDRVVELSEP